MMNKLQNLQYLKFSFAPQNDADKSHSLSSNKALYSVLYMPHLLRPSRYCQGLLDIRNLLTLVLVGLNHYTLRKDSVVDVTT